MKLQNKLLKTLVFYDGKVVPLGQVYVELQKIAPSQACLDRYIQGLLLKTKQENNNDKKRI